MTKELTCICCPMGCRLGIELDDGTGDILSVIGNTCKRGHDYGISELTAPVRMVTTTVRTPEGVSIPVKTKEPVPKDKIFECMEDIKKAVVHTPVHTGDIIVENAAGTDIPVIATRSL